MLFNKLTEKDIERIDSYRKTFAGSCENKRADLSTILRYWNKNKEWMAPYFGDSLIKEIPVEYKEGEDELRDKIHDWLWNSKPEYAEFYRSLERFYPYPSYRLSGEEWQAEYKLHHAITCLFSTTTLMNNKVDFGGEYTSITIPLPNNCGDYTIQNGAKPMRAIRKLAEAVDFKHFEEFRNDHSRCLQAKSLSGKLCLSIHPLDFMTMSDNECDWSSCMSWRENGEYRLGTVEMMNSPVVICAYLESEHNPLAWSYEGTTYEWNSKKWRCLFIVDYNKLCLSVKSYPFYNGGLTALAAKEIAKLFGWGECEATKYDYNDAYHNGAQIGNYEVSVVCETGAMYNDCGSTDHWIILGPDASPLLRSYSIDYSGEANCMCCGELVEWEEDCADTLTCDGGWEYCSCCDHRMSRYSDDWYWVEDERVCDYCANEHAVYDNILDQYIWRDNARELYLSKSNEKLSDDIYSCRTCYVGDRVHKDYPSYWNESVKIPEPRYDEELDIYYVCPKDCTNFGLRVLFNMYGTEEQQDEALKSYMNDDRDEEPAPAPPPSIDPMEI